MPYPATAAGPAAAPTSAVASATVSVVCIVETEATAPTRRMSANRRTRGRTQANRTTAAPDAR